MNKLFFTLGLFALVGLIGLVSLLPNEVKPNILGGGNLPDNCTHYTQIASRSTKDVIKSAPGRILGFTVTSSASEAVYFQVYDRSNTTLPGAGLATPSFVMPIPAETAVEGLGRVDYTFAVPFGETASGITFGLSGNFANYSRPDFNANAFVVDLCYY